MINVRKAIGIDVCKTAINVVRLERTGDKIILADSMHLPFEQDWTQSQDASLYAKKLSHALKTLKLTTRLEHCDASICLNSLPDLLQILKLPETTPHNVIKYIHDEIRQYAVLPLKNIKIDYCALRSCGADSKHVLVGACQTPGLIEIARELENIQVDARLIEPAVISLIRACYKNIISSAQGRNIMIALLRDDVFHISVFSVKKFDFLRTKKLEIENSEPNSCSLAIAEQIESVLQFYELEKTFAKSNWQVFLDSNQSTSNAASLAEQLKNVIGNNIEINPVLPQHLNVTVKPNVQDFSTVAVGAAMKVLELNDSDISINMIPDEISEIRKSNKNLLMIINTAAVILILLFLHISHLTIRSTQADQEIAKRAKNQLGISIAELSRAYVDANEQATKLSAHISKLQQILPQSSGSNWAYILAEVCSKVPQTVQIRNLQSGGANTIAIEGVAVNYAAVKDFIDSLSSCKTISSPQLVDTKQNIEYGEGFIDYSINCRPADKK